MSVMGLITMDAGERLESIKVPNWVQETGGVPYCVMLGV